MVLQSATLRTIGSGLGKRHGARCFSGGGAVLFCAGRAAGGRRLQRWLLRRTGGSLSTDTSSNHIRPSTMIGPSRAVAGTEAKGPLAGGFRSRSQILYKISILLAADPRRAFSGVYCYPPS